MPEPGEDAGITPGTLFIPAYTIIIALSIYGPIEYAHMSHTCTASHLNSLTCLILNAAFIGCVVTGWLLTARDVSLERPSRTFLITAPLVTFLVCYTLGVGITDLEKVEFLKVPNVAPWLLTWEGCRNYVTIDPYHLLLFGAGFMSLITALAIPAGISFGRKAMAKAVVINLGALMVGLTYQDWFWFVACPRTHLTCGSRYGVFFSQWLCFGSIEVPAMYVVAHAVGIPMIILPSIRSYRRRLAPYVMGLLGLIAALITAGITYAALLK